MVPFLKWAGGKRWLFDNEFLAKIPPFRRYFEPFLGGGAGFFAIQPEHAVLSDINAELIEVYEAVRDYPAELTAALAEKQTLHSLEFYYETRKVVPDDTVSRAARTLYLNRTCWNGLYRLNKKGEFNVPRGTKTTISLPSDDFVKAAQALKDIDLRCCDFDDTIRLAGDGDLIFADPPYTVKHNLNGFLKYNEKIFSWEDQVRLRDSLVSAAQRGASIILTNADHASVADLYRGVGDHQRRSRSSVISGKSSGRSVTTELLVYL